MTLIDESILIHLLYTSGVSFQAFPRTFFPEQQLGNGNENKMVVGRWAGVVIYLGLHF